MTRQELRKTRQDSVETPAISPASEDSLVHLTKQLARGTMSRKEFLMRATALGLTLPAVASLIAACGSTSTSSSSASASPAALDTTLPEKLFLFNWAEYMAPEVKKSFEKTYGIKVVETYFESNEALLAKLQAGVTGYDIIVPDGMTVHVMLKSGLIQPLHMDSIPNFKYVMARFQKPDYDPGTEGGKYSIPYQWGTTGIGHRKDLLPDSITKWADMWNTAYKDKMVMLDDERDTLGAGLIVTGHSINTLDQADLDEAVEKLVAQKPMVKAYDSINTKRFLMGGTPLCHGWSGYVLQAYEPLGPDKLEYVLPSEAFAMYCDNMAIPVGAPSPYAGHLFMNYILDPKIAAKIVDYTWYSSPVPEAKQYSNPVVWDFVPSEETLARGELIQDVGSFRTSYDQAWTTLKSS